MSAFSVITRETSKGLDAFKKAFNAIRQAGSYVKVGVLAEDKGLDTHTAGGPTIAEIAAVHEFGSHDGRIPERSFMRSTFAEHRAEYVEIMRKLLVQLVDQKIDVKTLLGRLGLKISIDMRKKITIDGVPPPNAPSTVAAKLALSKPGAMKSVRTLVDTGQLVRAITYAVVISVTSMLHSKPIDPGDSNGP